MAFLFLFPVHIIRVDDSLTGYPASLEAKKNLLALEENVFTI